MAVVEITYRYGGAEPRPRPASPDAARERLERGNASFAALLAQVDASDGGFARHVVEVDARELGMGGAGAAPLQRPFAAVLGCADARVPLELVFSEGPNDLFAVRVAGNALGPDILGSLRYAIDHLADDLRLVAVVGHGGCGAIGAAVDTFLLPAGYLDLAGQHELRGIVENLLPTVLSAARVLDIVHGADVRARAGYRAALAELAVVLNAAIGAFTLRGELARAGASERVGAVYGAYAIDTRRIWAPAVDDSERSGLTEPPADLAGFRQLGRAAAESARIRRLLR